ncbi:MAG: nuclear transport factor 2 family protein [Betaproteobacteria bacterium]|nr:nuclear transport factor 2 family protein [Betaproteobacteria bacterium]
MDKLRIGLFSVAVCIASCAIASPEDEVRAQLRSFVAAQNAHDLKTVGDLLLDSPNFLWITRGAPVWGREAALKRFEALYQGNWKLEPSEGELKVTMLRDDVAQIFMPILFTIGPANQPAQQTRFLMNQVIVKTAQGWKTATILPIPAAAQ